MQLLGISPYFFLCANRGIKRAMINDTIGTTVATTIIVVEVAEELSSSLPASLLADDVPAQPSYASEMSKISAVLLIVWLVVEVQIGTERIALARKQSQRTQIRNVRVVWSVPADAICPDKGNCAFEGLN